MSDIRAAIRRLLGQQSTGVFGPAEQPPQAQPLKPAAAGAVGSGIFAQQLASEIGTGTNPESAMEAVALNDFAQREQATAEQAAAAAAAQARQLAVIDGDAKARAAGIPSMITNRDAGTSNYIEGLFDTDPVVTMAERAGETQARNANTFKDVFGGVKDAYGAGVHIPTEAITNRITFPTDVRTTPVENFNPDGYSPSDANTKQANADDREIGLANAGSARIAALKKEGEAGGGEISITYDDVSGAPRVGWKGKPGEMTQAIMDQVKGFTPRRESTPAEALDANTQRQLEKSHPSSEFDKKVTSDGSIQGKRKGVANAPWFTIRGPQK